MAINTVLNAIPEGLLSPRRGGVLTAKLARIFSRSILGAREGLWGEAPGAVEVQRKTCARSHARRATAELCLALDV
jgi:hypothetical protein